VLNPSRIDLDRMYIYISAQKIGRGGSWTWGERSNAIRLKHCFVLLVVDGESGLNGLDSNDGGVDESSGVEGGQSQEGEH